MEHGSQRLLADSMLGRLAKWLRLLGYDVAYDNAAADRTLVRRARTEQRILLTRDRELARRRGLRTLLIESQSLDEQVEQVWQALGPPPHPALSRCAVCNATLQSIAAADATGHVPPYVLRTQDRFRQCPLCKRIFWRGTHFRAIRNRLRQWHAQHAAEAD